MIFSKRTALRLFFALPVLCLFVLFTGCGGPSQLAATTANTLSSGSSVPSISYGLGSSTGVQAPLGTATNSATLPSAFSNTLGSYYPTIPSSLSSTTAIQQLLNAGASSSANNMVAIASSGIEYAMTLVVNPSITATFGASIPYSVNYDPNVVQFANPATSPGCSGPSGTITSTGSVQLCVTFASPSTNYTPTVLQTTVGTDVSVLYVLVTPGTGSSNLILLTAANNAFAPLPMGTFPVVGTTLITSDSAIAANKPGTLTSVPLQNVYFIGPASGSVGSVTGTPTISPPTAGTISAPPSSSVYATVIFNTSGPATITVPGVGSLTVGVGSVVTVQMAPNLNINANCPAVNDLANLTCSNQSANPVMAEVIVPPNSTDVPLTLAAVTNGTPGSGHVKGIPTTLPVPVSSAFSCAGGKHNLYEGIFTIVFAPPFIPAGLSQVSCTFNLTTAGGTGIEQQIVQNGFQ